MTPLRRLLQEQREPDSEVARRWEPSLRRDLVVDWAEFRRDVATLKERLDVEPEGAWVLLTEDAYAFAVGLFGLWHSGRHAISPPNRQQGTLRELQTRAAGVLSDRPDWIREGSSLHPLASAARANPASLEPLDPDALAVEFFTSGTTGTEKSVVKHIRHLESEIVELGAKWDSLIGDSTSVFSTVSHQHLYGFLFGMLWPLCSRHTFQAFHFLYAEELVPRLLAADAFALASVPTSLKRFIRHRDAASLRTRCRAVFSSGGPLLIETAHSITRAMGHAPIEVLGSTETGGIAWRSQKPDSAESLWSPFSAVRLTCSGEGTEMRVQSPFVSVDAGEDGFVTGDRISLQRDGRFRLHQRSDQVVKIGEKRLDRAKMASQLRGHSWVDDVALTTVDRDGELRVAAVVVPTAEGWSAIERNGRRSFGRELRAALADGWDPVLHPRFWRTVRRLPENTQGKVTDEALRQLFQPFQPASSSDRPEILNTARGNDFIQWSCVVPPDLSCLPGHFFDFPVVPGVLQLDWAMEMAARILEEPFRVEEVESIKLIAPLRPGDRFEMTVRIASATKLVIQIFSGDTVYMKGRVRVAALPEVCMS